MAIAGGSELVPHLIGQVVRVHLICDVALEVAFTCTR
jgi:hypothetical protein